MLPDTASVVEPESTPSSEETHPEPTRSVWWSISAVLAIVVIAVLVAIIFATGSNDESADTPVVASEAESLQTIRYLVPRGTGDRIDAGEDVSIIPQVLHIPIGTTIQIVNDDTITHTVGGYFVRAGDTLDITYPRVGLYMNACSTNTAELVYIYVDAVETDA